MTKGHYFWKIMENYSQAREWKHTKRNGEGANFYIDGEIARGKFVNDKLNGFGTTIYANGDKSVGNFKDFEFMVLQLRRLKMEKNKLVILKMGKGKVNFKN